MNVSPAHKPYVTHQEASRSLDDGVEVKANFHPTKKWLISCPAHNAAVEILHSPESNEFCFKKIGDRTVNYRKIPVEGYSFKYHGTKTDFSYIAPASFSNVTLNGRPLSSYSSEEQAYYRAEVMAGLQEDMAGLQEGMAGLQAGMADLQAGMADLQEVTCTIDTPIIITCL